MSGKDPMLGLDLGTAPGILVDSDLPVITAADLIEPVKEEFQRQGEVAPADEKILVLARVIAGYLRTSPRVEDDGEHGRHLAVESFVGACPGWWLRDTGDYGKVAALLDDVFHQRDVAIPPAASMDMLHGITVGIMRRKRLPRGLAAQFAMADWVATLYLAGLDDW